MSLNVPMNAVPDAVCNNKAIIFEKK